MKALVMAVISVVSASAGSTPQNLSQEEFQQKYQAWRAYLQAHPMYRYMSQGGPEFACTEFKEIVRLGIPALPYIVETIAQDPQEDRLWKAISEIAKIQIHTDFNAEEKRTVFPDFPHIVAGEQDPYVFWWREGYRGTPARFFKHYDAWRLLQAQHEELKAKKEYRYMRDLGIAAFPLVMQKMKAGDGAALVPIVSAWTDGQVKTDATVAQCLAWWEQNRQKWLLPFPNGKPVAKTTGDRTAGPGETVSLDGSGSSDPEGSALSYRWTQVGGPAVVLSDSTAPMVQFVTPRVSRRTVLVFQLVVDDAADTTRAVPTLNSRSEPTIVRITVDPKRK